MKRQWWSPKLILVSCGGQVNGDGHLNECRLIDVQPLSPIINGRNVLNMGLDAMTGCQRFSLRHG